MINSKYIVTFPRVGSSQFKLTQFSNLVYTSVSIAVTETTPSRHFAWHVTQYHQYGMWFVPHQMHSLSTAHTWSYMARSTRTTSRLCFTLRSPFLPCIHTSLCVWYTCMVEKLRNLLIQILCFLTFYPSKSLCICLLNVQHGECGIEHAWVNNSNELKIDDYVQFLF